MRIVVTLGLGLGLGLALALALASCKKSPPPDPVGASASASTSATPTTASSETKLVLYPSAPTAPWGEPLFFDPDESRPKTKVAFDNVVTHNAGVAESGAVRHAIEGAANQFQWCYWKVLSRDRSLKQQRIRLSLQIDQGIIVHITSAGEEGAAAALNSDVMLCVQTQASQLRVSKEIGPITVEVVLTLSPG